MRKKRKRKRMRKTKSLSYTVGTSIDWSNVLVEILALTVVEQCVTSAAMESTLTK